jgi:hypothetical protein
VCVCISLASLRPVHKAHSLPAQVLCRADEVYVISSIRMMSEIHKTAIITFRDQERGLSVAKQRG